LLPILGGALWANAVAEKLIAASISKTLTVIFPSALVLFCAKQSERLRVKFDRLHAALEHAADQRP
jgi:hypothetical protein